MTIDQLTGFMLGDAEHPMKKGDKWWPYDTQVFVCMDIERAVRILKEHQKNYLEPNNVWTTVYRVTAQNLEFTKIENGLIWTNQPTKIIVDGPVYFSNPKAANEASLLKNAQTILPHIAKLIDTVYNQREYTK